MCRICRSAVGRYIRFTDAFAVPDFAQVAELTFQPQVLGSGEIFKFNLMCPNRSIPVLFYLWDPGYMRRVPPGQVLNEARVASGWIGTPLLESEYPNLPGAYPSIDTVRPVENPSRRLLPEVMVRFSVTFAKARSCLISSILWSVIVILLGLVVHFFRKRIEHPI
jgi:hypothetical protein